jgi:hypothetical protein
VMVKVMMMNEIAVMRVIGPMSWCSRQNIHARLQCAKVGLQEQQDLLN